MLAQKCSSLILLSSFSPQWAHMAYSTIQSKVRSSQMWLLHLWRRPQWSAVLWRGWIALQYCGPLYWKPSAELPAWAVTPREGGCPHPAPHLTPHGSDPEQSTDWVKSLTKQSLLQYVAVCSIYRRILSFSEENIVLTVLMTKTCSPLHTSKLLNADNIEHIDISSIVVCKYTIWCPKLVKFGENAIYIWYKCNTWGVKQV